MQGGDSGPELTRIKRTHLLVKIQNGFTPIRLDDYIELHLQVNPETNRTELLDELQSAIDAHRKGVRCECGAPIWVIGSAQSGLACFTCITGEALPDNDYEIAIDPEYRST